MKNIFSRLLLLLPLLFCLTATAQQEDSLYKAKKLMDSAYRLMQQYHYVPDTALIAEHPRYIKRKIPRDTLLLQRKLLDSAKRKLALSYKSYKHVNDSLYKQKVLLNRATDSLERLHWQRKLKSNAATMRNTVKLDSFHQLKMYSGLHVKMDSLKRLQTLQRFKNDSSKKLLALNRKLDTLHRYKMLGTLKTDSLRKLLYLHSIKLDSQRLKKYLQQKKLDLQKFQADTITLRNGYRSRELSMEITCRDGDTVYINNNYKNVIIKVAKAQKLKAYTLINYKEPINERDNEILQKMGIALTRMQHRVTATINAGKTNNVDSAGCKELNAETNLRRPLYIELPGNVVIILNTKFADANIENYVQQINADINNGTLKLGNAYGAVIKSRYATIKADDIQQAKLDLSNSKFNAGNIVTLSVVSKSSIVQLNNCETMDMASISDNYKLDKAGSISGSKDFGQFNIENLKNKLVLSGANADVKIANLNYEAPFIKIDSKYADLKLPLYDQRNYSIYYEGTYKDINRVTTAAQKTTNTVTFVRKDTIASAGKTSLGTMKYEAVAGDITGKHAKIDIVCPYCNVVFN